MKDITVKIRERRLYLEKQSTKADKKYVKSGKLADRLEALEYNAQLNELINLTK